MLFTTPLFLFSFLPSSLIAYFLTPAAAANAALLVISMLFYFWGEPWFIFIIIISASVDFVVGNRLAQGGAGKACLTFGVTANIMLLVVFKYADFLVSNLEPLSGPLPHLHLLLPLGISFVVFEKITYLVDIYRRTGRPAESLRDYLLFVFFFPKMLAGPIIKYHEIEGAIRHRVSSWEDRTWGFLRFIWGLSKKVLIADVCGNAADLVFGQPLGSIGFTTAWVGVLAFTTEIYYDFSGYSDMAIGLARMFGFRLRENFDHPYGSASFTEFWRRWHISLSTWIRDYLYIPLGGNRRGKSATFLNLWTCFLLSGLWHGASWHFVFWGAWNGLFLVADRIFWVRLTCKLPRIIPVSITLFLIMVGWIIFRADNLAQLQDISVAILSPGLVGQFVRVRTDQVAAIVIGLGGALIASTTQVRTVISRAAESPSARAFVAFAIVLIGALATAKLITVTFRPFLYFRF
jgi:alginate O-acetyltransferase complex protein AlgI